MNSSQATFDGELASLADTERRARSVRERRERSDRIVLDSLSSTFLGTLIDMAETQAPVTILTRNGSSNRGSITAVTANALALSTSTDDATLLIRISAIEALLETNSTPKGAVHRRHVETPSDLRSFSNMLDAYTEPDSRLALTLASKNRVIGQLEHVGQDQVTLISDGTGETLTIPTHAIDQALVSP